ncbi:hypothetical protein [Streptosporangium subroseum]|uniref:hypothetical protein n=1 Tax=Streptosporangium subroseum TaxID=106412 RepID=UPI003084879C|nr:hypothetical protein OHB15_23970 [Streptosporangium subroseum]
MTLTRGQTFGSTPIRCSLPLTQQLGIGVGHLALSGAALAVPEQISVCVGRTSRLLCGGLGAQLVAYGQRAQQSAVVLTVFWYVTLANLHTGRIRLPRGAHRVATAATRYHTSVLMVWMLTVVGLIVQRFWSYWITLI